VLEEDCCRTAFVRGAFLAGGSVTDPEKRNHLELATPHRSISPELTSILLDMELEPKEAMRGNVSLLYMKRSEMISDFITKIGAPAAALTVMTAKLEKEVNNRVSRAINCAFANADRTVSTAQEQIAVIRQLKEEYGLGILPDELQDAALLRITNPEASLAQLSQLSYPHLSKSCLAYRLKKIMEFNPQDVE